MQEIHGTRERERERERDMRRVLGKNAPAKKACKLPKSQSRARHLMHPSHSSDQIRNDTIQVSRGGGAKYLVSARVSLFLGLGVGLGLQTKPANIAETAEGRAKPLVPGEQKLPSAAPKTLICPVRSSDNMSKSGQPPDLKK